MKKLFLPFLILQFAFINDIVNIVIKLVKNKMIGKKINKIYNIANDYLTYDQLIKMNSRKRDNKYIKDEIIKNVLVDNTKIKRDLNFKFTSNKKAPASFLARSDCTDLKGWFLMSIS